MMALLATKFTKSTSNANLHILFTLLIMRCVRKRYSFVIFIFIYGKLLMDLSDYFIYFIWGIFI